MTRYLAMPDCPVLCCESSQQRVITCDSRLDPDAFSPQSARTGFDQRFHGERLSAAVLFVHSVFKQVYDFLLTPLVNTNKLTAVC